MLVLTVREGDVIQIGDNVRVMVRAVKKGMLKACIDAPPDVLIQRLSAADPQFQADDAEAAELPEPAVFVTTRRRRPGSARD